MNKQSNSAWYNTPHWKITRAYLLRTEITKSHLNNHICQHRDMKTSTVTLSFYYVFNISLYCNDAIPSFIGNLWRALLLGNHLALTTRFIIIDLYIINNYYMASSANGQDDPNGALWLATRAGKMEPSCPLGTTRSIPQEKYPWKPHNKSFIDQVCLVKMAGYWPRSFFASLWTSTSSRSINTQKRTWPISSHLDLTLGQ